MNCPATKHTVTGHASRARGGGNTLGAIHPSVAGGGKCGDREVPLSGRLGSLAGDEHNSPAVLFRLRGSAVPSPGARSVTAAVDISPCPPPLFIREEHQLEELKLC